MTEDTHEVRAWCPQRTAPLQIDQSLSKEPPGFILALLMRNHKILFCVEKNYVCILLHADP